MSAADVCKIVFMSAFALGGVSVVIAFAYRIAKGASLSDIFQ